jgi:hypothetical protein
MKVWGGLLVIVLTALGLAALALRPHAPRPASAPVVVFSAARAMPDVVAIAQRPHPIGSPDSRRVQDYLTRRMATLGLAPQTRPFDSPKGSGRNLLGVLPGTDRATPAVLLMAHADSVPAGPGAADDGAGVAAVLETVRALRAMGPARRDLMVLITDGEEAGLLGARAFFSADPARAHVGVVINLEARGDRGRAVMFETHASAAPLIARLVDKNALGGASSLMPDLYRRLPNETDLTVALQHGYAGMNFAFFAGFDAYHRPTDTPQRLDPASLQHLGDQALNAAQFLTRVGALPGRAPDQVYSDIMGGPVLQYPAVVGWGLLVLAAGGIAVCAISAVQERRASPAGIAGGVLAFVVLMLVLAAALTGEGVLRERLADGRLAPLLRMQDQALAGARLLTGGVCLLWLWVAGRALRPGSLAFGALAAVAVLAGVLQALAPLDAFVASWPLVVAVIGAVLSAPDKPFVAPLFALAVCAQVFYWSGLIFPLVGQTAPVVLAPFAALGAMALLPLAPRATATVAIAGGAPAAAGLGLGLLAVMG